MIVWNGPLECKYHKFEMYRGSRKEKAEETPTEN
jgi:hypothetical protein